VQKVSIVARGMAGGYTLLLPEDDRTLSAGRASWPQWRSSWVAAGEEIGLRRHHHGAANDLEQTTHIARSMVTQYGMSERLGPLTFGAKEELVFLGKEIGEQRNYSEDVALAIDEEVQNLVNEAYQPRTRRDLSPTVTD